MKRGRPTASSPSGPEIEWIPVSQLRLDPANPRLRDAGLDESASEADILRVLWSKTAVDEVALSIAANGYFDHEPIFAERSGSGFVVVEGNRRLAAVKLLVDPTLRATIGARGLPEISAADAAELRQLPTIVCRRKDVWTYLGFKHINGPQSWESFAKAHYVAWVHNELGIALSSIAERIGDQHSTVERLYDALMVLQQAERESVFSSEDRYKKHFAFSHLTTGLGYSGVRSFLGLPAAPRTLGRQNPVPKGKLKELGEFLRWLYGNRSDDIPPVVRTQNPDLRQLDEVLSNPTSIAALRQSLPLSVSVEISRGDERVFRESLVGAKQSLQKAQGTVVTGYTGGGDLLELAQDIALISAKLLADMQKVPRGPKKKK